MQPTARIYSNTYFVFSLKFFFKKKQIYLQRPLILTALYKNAA